MCLVFQEYHQCDQPQLMSLHDSIQPWNTEKMQSKRPTECTDLEHRHHSADFQSGWFVEEFEKVGACDDPGHDTVSRLAN